MKWEICEQLVFDFLKRKSGHTKNAKSNGNQFWLFNNKIAEFRENELFVCDGNYKHTQSTARYLNAMDAHITLKKGQFYKNKVMWDGEWIKVYETPVGILEQNRKSLFN